MLSENKHTLEIDSIELRFSERPILTNVYLKIETGKITALLGRNGCGKSCLMRILFDDLKPKYKSIRIDSKWRKNLSSKEVLYLPQFCCIPRYHRIENVFKDFRADFDEFISIFPNMRTQASSRIFELSEGERRLVEIFTIIKADSQFIMLDEPFSQIMPLYIDAIKALILEEKQRKGILLTDHLYKNVIDIADSLYIINNQSIHLAKTNDDLIKYGYIHHL